MKIIYLHQYFKTPEEGGAIRSYLISRALVQAGFQVEVITSHNQKGYICKNIDNIKVHYLPVYYDNKLGTLFRIVSFLKFTWRCYFRARSILRQNKDIPCLCYATSTPLTVGWVALKLSQWLKLPYYFEVRDLWPQAPVELGVIKHQWIKRNLYQLEQRIYQGAQKIIALSPGMAASINRTITTEKVTMVSNMADCDFFKPSNKTLGNSFVISHIGTVGVANHLEYFIEIARLAQKTRLDQLQFWIIGEGKCLEKIRCQAKSLKNVIFHAPTNKAGVKKILDQSQATYTSFLQKPVLETNSPNKFFDSLAAGKLSIVNTKGWLKELVENNQCGFYANPLEPTHFIQQISPFLKNPALLKESQQNARNLAENLFSTEQLTQKVVYLVKQHFSQ